MRGTLEGYPVPQCHKKNRQILKYSVENQQNTNNAYMIGHVYVKLYPCHVFVCLKHVCTRNQPQTLRENVRINKTLNLSHLQDLSNSEAGEDQETKNALKHLALNYIYVQSARVVRLSGQQILHVLNVLQDHF